MTTQSLETVARDVLTRGLAVIGLLGIALIHVLDAIPTFSELPYKGWMYTSLIVSAVVVAGMLVRGSSRAAWAASATLVLGAIAAFVYSRTVGLPGAAADIGNWSEPLGVAALFVESAVLAVSAYAMAAVAPARARAERRGVLAAA
ncbi:MAG: hypothetical protein QOF77_2374 [Solirubrobacteraceae bacterium]|jgi:hypothetical protein|nr:hypothetical protein [Solirubrobacteraceae bacterium]